MSLLARLTAPLVILCACVRAFADPAPEPPDERYQPPAESRPQPGVASGTVTPLDLGTSRVFPGYRHEAWLYVPAGAEDKALALMVFQDGGGFVDPNGPWRAPTVLDNLIAARELPPMAALFVNPGHPEKDDGLASEQRSYEYDTLSGRYAEFLIEEALPKVRAHVRIGDDPAGRGIAGLSSGGICAFTVAWRRPDAFRKVFSAVGSFVDIRGGGAYPEIVRGAAVKPLRIFMQDGAQDRLGGPFAGLDWPAGSRALARALALKDYDFQFVMGQGTHNPRHGAAIFPAAMRWLWRDYPR